MNILQRNNARSEQDVTLEELRRIRLELIALRKLFDHFAGTFLNSRFPFGKPVDRWGRR